MRVLQENQTFHPISIVLETKEEALMFRKALFALTDDEDIVGDVLSHEQLKCLETLYAQLQTKAM